MQVGSTEWVEQNIDLLGVNAVAYLNQDACAIGLGFSAGASPQLDDLLQEVTKHISFVNPLGEVLLLLFLSDSRFWNCLLLHSVTQFSWDIVLVAAPLCTSIVIAR
jgi:hypothetical protein